MRRCGKTNADGRSPEPHFWLDFTCPATTLIRRSSERPYFWLCAKKSCGLRCDGCFGVHPVGVARSDLKFRSALQRQLQRVKPCAWRFRTEAQQEVIWHVIRDGEQ